MLQPQQPRLIPLKRKIPYIRSPRTRTRTRRLRLRRPLRALPSHMLQNTRHQSPPNLIIRVRELLRQHIHVPLSASSRTDVSGLGCVTAETRDSASNSRIWAFRVHLVGWGVW